MHLIPETLKRELTPFWRYWNLGRYAYFKNPHPRLIGNAKLVPFVIDDREAALEYLKKELSSSAGGRWVPEGQYVKLMKFQDDVHGLYDDGPIWQSVMSDTPDEMNDHAQPILNAHGRVLVHGLGLGCVLNCIRQRPDVNHIDVVEVDEDVLKLISPFYADDERIEFHIGSCVGIKWPRGTRWNYVWHDIWTTIASHNLTDDSEAEHGISYARLHRMFAGRCDQQNSWAFERARDMRTVERMQAKIIASWAFGWSVRSKEERLEMLIEATCPIGMATSKWKFFLTDNDASEFTGSNEMYERYKQRAERREMPVEEAAIILDDKTRRYAMQKIGMV